MLSQKIGITGIASISALGHDPRKAWKHYLQTSHLAIKKEIGGQEYWVAPLEADSEDQIQLIREENNHYRGLDRSVLLALLVSRLAVINSGWEGTSSFGINFGSSRGATGLFERYHRDFLERNSTATRTSPNTTLGNISSWVAHDLQIQGPEISHSITCSTALHALLNGIAWLQSGMTDKFLVGGSEAALTPFTLAQMSALKIYSEANGQYPCRALDLQKSTNSMILGEGAGAICLEADPVKDPLVYVGGVGYATEPLEHSVSLSTDAKCFQRSMSMALNGLNPGEVDAVVMHAPGTIKGDLSEYRAIESVFKDKMPALTTNKWKIGHTFGASGILSLEMGIMMMMHQQFIPVPFVDNKYPEKLNNILVNAVGFGGNAVSILLQLPF
ncbi:beta-ketoacyl synthase N-terminal-like domain-containing protein [Lentiprolixibacter aurantiacus]|uniref:Beta-ketoacyl synthase N-terminal-like domain-containing protein n=1 Tax=Lentiprolixibacter aurantiacus TaxID=2993939 RepID=A0AAE3MIQ0_9FLAO|nr:beta-ketoacyl synthase N-terminal-like domain-containing protein [Lentiprolixibacter aurantiacus]MCX2718286.1 beta-ketoacyl synthase N-terminal-like domain-containing protein [Lentiprolixibacter aurantiacus]